MLSYADAARLIGGGESQQVKALDRLTGGLLIAGAVAGAPALLGWLDARTEFVRLSHDLVRKVSERRTGISRYTRTQRLEAAHTILVVTAYFEALAEADLPFRFADLELTKDEQLNLAGTDGFQSLLTTMVSIVPSLEDDSEDRLRLWRDLFADLSGQLARLVRGLAVWDRLSETDRTAFDRALARRRELAQAYRKALERPIVSSGEVPDDLRLPTLESGYIVPAFRVDIVHHQTKLNEESWWENRPVREDLEEFLIGYLTSGGAVEAPLLVLGHPGSGKSVLTQVLAARLPAADFLPVRVALREVPAAAPLQDQIESAVRETTGERVDWPALARSAADALPVVILDGFDELLQATGVSQTDYLIRVADFQRRELDQDRPVAVIVTSRTSVADRARTPDGTVAMRLEPFDARRVAAWLRVWNATNESGFRIRGLKPLPASAVLAHRELAGQPLLLLMLALYDADGNALQRGAAGLRADELYERLLTSFARREVAKLAPGLPVRELDQAVELELRRLSVAAFGMFNRGSQWITEADLESDLLALLGEATPAPAANQLRAPLRPAELVLGRFFFIHRAQATRDDTRLETYEFLHATFGEFLVARFTWQVLRHLAAWETASIVSLSATPVDDDLLHALLSFGVLSQRAPIVDFLTDLSGQLAEPARAALVDLLVRLFRMAHQPRSGREHGTYQPRPTAVPARHAAYSANLVLLTVCVAGQIRASQLFGPEIEAIEAWRAEAMLWRSQLGSGWATLLEALAVHRLWDGDGRDLSLTLHGDAFLVPAIDPSWTFGWTSSASEQARKVLGVEIRGATADLTAQFLCLIGEDVSRHTLEPLADALGSTLYLFSGWGEGPTSSAARILLDAWLLPCREPTAEERRAVYERCLAVALGDHLAPGVRLRYTMLFLDRLTTDDTVPAGLAADLLRRLVSGAKGVVLAGVPERLMRCATAFLGRGNGYSDRELARVVRFAHDHPGGKVGPATTETAMARLASLGIRPGGG